jgi:hypothetical protein
MAMKSMAHPEAVGRRHLVGATALIAVGTELGIIRPARVQTDGQHPPTASASKPPGTLAFGDLKQVEVGTLSVGFIDAGPGDGPAVILLHGLAI